MSELPAAFDAARLIAEVRRGDAEALRLAYIATFDNALGRLVLAHHLGDCGVGDVFGREDLKYRAGRHDAALELAQKAGFDPASIAVGVLTGTLEESNHETARFEPPAYVPADDEELG